MLLVSYLNNAHSDSIVLPKDPGEANNFTIEGIDSNKNGVRDDVEILIWKEITQDPKIFKAYMKWAETELMKLRYPKDVKLQQKLWIQSYNDINCISHFQQIDAKNIHKLVHTIVNTHARENRSEEVTKLENGFPNKKSIPPEKRLGLCRF